MNRVHAAIEKVEDVSCMLCQSAVWQGLESTRAFLIPHATSYHAYFLYLYKYSTEYS